MLCVEFAMMEVVIHCSERHVVFCQYSIGRHTTDQLQSVLSEFSSW